MTETKLKPCPFCGGEGSYANGGFGFIVKCRKCGSRIDVQNTTEEAAKAWNNRRPAEKLEAENKRLREALERIVSEHPACFEDADCPHKGGAGYDQGCLSCPWVIAEETLREGEK